MGMCLEILASDRDSRVAKSRFCVVIRALLRVTKGSQVEHFCLCGRWHGCIVVCRGCGGSAHRICLAMVGVGGDTSRAPGTWECCGLVVCFVSLVFYFMYFGDMGVPGVHTRWCMGSEFVAF